MNRTLSLLVLSVVAGLFAPVDGIHAAPSDPLKVVATIPDLADIVKEIGGDRVDAGTDANLHASITAAVAAATEPENAHAVVVKPSHLIAMNKADMFVQIGLSLETAFVPGLLEGSRNPKIQPGKPGFVNCSDGWQAIEVPAHIPAG